MKCPVCKTELADNARVCHLCNFSRLHVEFSSVYAATNWVETVVLPYREQWESKRQQTEQQNRDNNFSHHVDNTPVDLSDFEYKFDEKGAVLTKYLKYGFKSTVRIPDVIYGKNVYHLDASLFKDCKEIESVYIPSTVRIIGDSAFQNTGIKKIQLPPYLSIIGSFSFCGSNLQEINLPYCVSFIGEGAFKDTNISNIIFPERIRNIPRDVCSGCHSLKSATILGAEDLSAYAFSFCYNLEKLLLPETLVTISNDKERHTNSINPTRYSPFKLKDTATLVLPKSLESIYIGQSMPARIIIAQNSNMKWNEDSSLSDFVDLSDIFGSFLGGNKQTNYTIYCIPGSTSHEFARKKGYNVKQLFDFK